MRVYVAKKVLNEKLLSLADVKNILEERSKEGELKYEQRLTLDYCTKFAKLNPSKIKKLIKELMEANEKVKERQAVKISDLMPKTVDDVRVIFAKERFNLNEDEIKKIIEIVDKYRE